MSVDDEMFHYFESFFELGDRANKFYKQHGLTKKTYPRNPKGAIDIYKQASDEIKAKFATLSVERQMTIMLVPVRGQARFKKSGVGAYIAWKDEPQKERERWVQRRNDCKLP